MIEKESRLLRIGVLGAGPIAQSAHFDATRKARNAELYAICDAAADLLTQVAATHRPQVTYTDYDQMLADPLLEAVVIGVADQFHAPRQRRAIAAGKHVLVEKPLGVSVEECEGCATTCARVAWCCRSGTTSASIPALPSLSGSSASRSASCWG